MNPLVVAFAIQAKEQTASLQTALLRTPGVRGPRYKPHESATFEIQRSATTVIDRAWLSARQQNSRALLSFGLTSSCYSVEQQITGRRIGSYITSGRQPVQWVPLPCQGIIAFCRG